MTRRTARLGRFALRVAAIGLATMVLGWLGPVFVGLVFVAVDGRESGPAESAAAAGTAWPLVLLVTALDAGARPVGLIAAALTVPVIVLPLASILFAAGLAWSSATLTLAVRRAIAGSPPARSLVEPGGR